MAPRYRWCGRDGRLNMFPLLMQSLNSAYERPVRSGMVCRHAFRPTFPQVPPDFTSSDRIAKHNGGAQNRGLNGFEIRVVPMAILVLFPLPSQPEGAATVALEFFSRLRQSSDTSCHSNTESQSRERPFTYSHRHVQLLTFHGSKFTSAYLRKLKRQ